MSLETFLLRTQDKSDDNTEDNSPGFTVYQKLKAKTFPCT